MADQERHMDVLERVLQVDKQSSSLLQMASDNFDQ